MGHKSGWGRGNVTSSNVCVGLTNSIGTKTVQHATLCDGFERRASQDAVHSLPQEVVVAQIRRHIKGQLPQLAVVGVRHAGEADTKPRGWRRVLSQV